MNKLFEVTVIDANKAIPHQLFVSLSTTCPELTKMFREAAKFGDDVGIYLCHKGKTLKDGKNMKYYGVRRRDFIQAVNIYLGGGGGFSAFEFSSLEETKKKIKSHVAKTEANAHRTVKNGLNLEGIHPESETCQFSNRKGVIANFGFGDDVDIGKSRFRAKCPKFSSCLKDVSNVYLTRCAY